MTRLYPSDLAAFVRRFRFAGGRLRRVRLRYTADGPAAEVVVAVRPAATADADAPVRLRLRFVGVEEFRFQKRPSTPGGRVSDARVGYFGDLYFLNLDAFGLAPGEVPKMHDYRASDAYLAGRELWWEEIERKG